ncbi:nuclease-related domain-containing protein [Neobacillus rhizophilus]|uniref:NERD domain-containing protein n=1 Tax=Neobacillus rhizophilus TaxID=2833579 RepID=A0A942UBV7_9BACI|nr:nuclease-related domain-containing protein [Neobacillus rhizophilus]MBS4216437.1 NERD domain-containing protein [Neobacillus rhizophilus]
MAYKPRVEPDFLKIMRLLNARGNLTEQERRYYENKQKGYDGEVMFDQLVTEQLRCEGLVLNDLLFKFNNTYFQIDTTIIFKETINLYDVKNFEGDYYYEGGKFFSINGEERKNPLLQLERCESYFRQLLHSLGYKCNVVSHLVHINPEFTLYQVPRNYPIIFPSQLNSLRKKLNNHQLKLGDYHKRLADKLISMHIIESPYEMVPAYSYEQLKKDMICDKCQSFSILVVDGKLVCHNCGHQVLIEFGILRCVEEFKLLFPKRKITTTVIYEWCGGAVSKKIIRQVLKKYFRTIGYGRWYYFE